MVPTLLKYTVGCFSLLVAGAAAAHADETRIRQADQNTQIRFSVNNEIRWTTTGLPSDFVQVVRGNGQVIASGTIQALKNHPLVLNWEQHSGGQISLRWYDFFPPPQLNGGYVAIWRGGSQVDVDPFVKQ